MGANLTSPLPHRSQTSVCNHLFSPGDGGPTFAPQRERTAKESVLMQGWNWSKRNIQPVMSRRSLSKSDSSSEATSSRSSDSLVSFTRSISSGQYTHKNGKMPIMVDKNQNYSTAKSESITIIPNYYSIREELRRGLKLNRQDDLMNNNNNNNNNNGHTSELRAIDSPKHLPRPKYSHESEFESILRTPTDTESTITDARCGKKTIIQASTSELLRGLGTFIANHCLVPEFEAAHLVTWLRSVDRALLLQGWQDIAFINPANLVFIFMIIRDILPVESQSIGTLEELHAWILSCLYVSYSYMGNEISYPLKPFLIETDRSAFWSRCVSMVASHSKKMLLLNSSSTFFTEVFTDLKRFSTSD